MKGKDGARIISFRTQKDFRKWLKVNHDKSQGVWARFYKKASGIKMMNYSEALDEALCFGWIDSLVNKFDEKSYIQKFTPRRSKSVWSEINREKIARLIKEGKMTPAGMTHVEAAKKDGRWEAAYASPSTAKLPADFMAALVKSKKAFKFFQSLNKTNRYAIFWQINSAKKEETRKRRINKFIQMLARKEKLY